MEVGSQPNVGQGPILTDAGWISCDLDFKVKGKIPVHEAS